MQIAVKSKLITTREQKDMLLETMIRFNEACDYVSQIAFKQKTFNKYKLHYLVYYNIRERFNLSAQFSERVIAKVADSYKKDKKILCKFKSLGAIIYDHHTVSYLKKINLVSILTLKGRTKVGIQYGDNRQFDLKTTLYKQSDLIYQNNEFYLMLTIDVPESESIETNEFLGIDLGIVNLATTSDGKIYSGEKCTKVRKRYAKLRAELQSVGTYSAKKHLKKISGRERRFKKDVNHCISKDIVKIAKDTDRSIVLEELTNIRSKKTASRKLNDVIGKWAFGELRNYIEYKAKENGIPVIFVDPQYTSQQCSVCGHTEKDNRKSQSNFKCKHCGHTENADFNAAKNIVSRALVNVPIVFYLSNQGFETQAFQTLV